MYECVYECLCEKYILQNMKKVNGYKEQKIYWALVLTQGSNIMY